MLVQDVKLTMSHTGLGDLNEYALLVLFGNVHSERLVLGLPIEPNQIVSIDGTTLYPAYFMTRLQVPLSQLLPTFKLWQTVTVGVDVRRFGDTLLESRYALAPAGKLPQRAEDWSAERYPVMQGNNLIVAESLNAASTKRSVLNPDPERIAELPRADRSPEGIALSRRVRRAGYRGLLEKPHFQSVRPFIHRVQEGRDCTQGHAMIFAKFAELFDAAEQQILTEQVCPAISSALLRRLHVLEREIYYFGNCYAGETVEIYLAGNFETEDGQEIVDEIDFIPGAYLNLTFEAYQQSTHALLSIATARKVFAIPMHEQENIHDLNRAIHHIINSNAADTLRA